MITRVGQCPKDLFNLEKIQAGQVAESVGQPMSYDQLVVMKPWGHEFLIFENEHVAIWYLSIKKGHSTSMHCHPLKKTSLVMLRGEAQCNTFETRNNVKGGEGVIIEKGVFHSTKSLSDGGIELLELETPPNKTDLVRLKDAYGRQKSGYEGLSEMKKQNLLDYGYFSFQEPERGFGNEITTEHYSLSMHSYHDSFELQRSLQVDSSTLYKICRGEIHSNGRVFVELGDAILGSDLMQAPGPLEISEKLVVLKVAPQ